MRFSILLIFFLYLASIPILGQNGRGYFSAYATLGMSKPFNAQYAKKNHASLGYLSELGVDWIIDRKLALGAELQNIIHPVDGRRAEAYLQKMKDEDLPFQYGKVAVNASPFKHRLLVFNLKYLFPISLRWWLDSKSGIGLNYFEASTMELKEERLLAVGTTENVRTFIHPVPNFTLVFSTGLGVNYNWKALWSARIGLMYYNSSSLSYLEEKEVIVNGTEGLSYSRQEDYRDYMASWLNLQLSVAYAFWR